MSKIILFLAITIMLSSLVVADFNPRGDIDLAGFFGIKNGVTINSSLFCTSGVCGTVTQFLTGAGGGFVSTDPPYLYDNSVTVFFNETKLNETISSLSGSDNSSWNESLANTLYAGIEWDYNQTEALNPNSTQMDFSNGNLNIKESWLTSLWNSIFNTKTTDDLTEGSTNKYEDGNTFNSTYDSLETNNNSWNESLADTLYLSIDATTGNLSWNQSLADELYAEIQWNYNQTLGVDQTYVEDLGFVTGIHTIIWNTLFNNTLTDFINTWIETKTTDDLAEGSINKYEDGNTFNATYDAKVTDNESWSEALANTLYDPLGGSGDNASWNQSFANTLYADISVVDTNESIRVNNLVDDNCLGNDKMVGVYPNGTVQCSAVAGGGDFSFADYQASFDSNLSEKNTDDLSEGSTNLYSQWDLSNGNISYTNGFVGIGTNTPSANLEVFRRANIYGNESHGELYVGNFNNISNDNKGGYLYLGKFGQPQGSGNSVGAIYFETKTTDSMTHVAGVQANIVQGQTTRSLTTGNLDFTTKSSGIDDPRSRLRIDENGNIGFGGTITDFDFTGSYMVLKNGDLNLTNGFYYGDGSKLTGVAGSGDFSFSDYQSSFNSNFSDESTDTLTEGSNKYDNQTWSESLADTLYSGIEWDYNQTEALNPNSTQMDFSNGNLNIKESWLDTVIGVLGYIKSAVTSVSAGNGMDFSTITSTGSVTLGTPSSLTAGTSNAVTSTSHTHAVSGFLESLVDDSSPQLGGYLDTNTQDIGSTTDEIENIYVSTNARIYFGDGQEVSQFYNGTVFRTQVT